MSKEIIIAIVVCVLLILLVISSIIKNPFKEKAEKIISILASIIVWSIAILFLGFFISNIEYKDGIEAIWNKDFFESFGLVATLLGLAALLEDRRKSEIQKKEIEEIEGRVNTHEGRIESLTSKIDTVRNSVHKQTTAINPQKPKRRKKKR